MRRDRHLRLAALLIGLCTTLGACRDDVPAEVGAPPEPKPVIRPITVAVAATGAPTSSQTSKRTYVVQADGPVLPDPAKTPGSAFADVDATVLCDLRYVQSVRQPRFNTKVAAFAAYGVSIRDRDIYHVDHLIPVSLGGDNEETNLWPQPDEADAVYQKDVLERHLRGLVCSGTLGLPEAQQAIAGDWWAARGRYLAIPVSEEAAGPPVPTTSTPTPGAVVNGGLCAVEGEIGYTQPKQIPLVCTARSDGTHHWQKRS